MNIIMSIGGNNFNFGCCFIFNDNSKSEELNK